MPSIVPTQKPAQTPPLTVLILGGSGKIGQLLRRVWSLAPPENTTLVWQNRRAGAEDVQFECGDDPARFGSVDAILSLWGGVVDLPANTRLAQEAQRIGAACGADRVLHFSSIAAYDPRTNGALKETAPLGNPAAYGAAKSDMERALTAEHTPQPCCLRIGSVAGAESLAAAMASGAEITLDQFPDGGSALRSYIAPTDLADVLLRLCRIPLTELPTALNIGAPHPVRMSALLDSAGRTFHWRAAPDGAREIAILDTALLQSLVHLPATTASSDHIIADLALLKVEPS